MNRTDSCYGYYVEHLTRISPLMGSVACSGIWVLVERIRGSHHIFTKEGVEEILNLQPKGRQAKPYQVKQVRGVILKYRLGGTPDVS